MWQFDTKTGLLWLSFIRFFCLIHYITNNVNSVPRSLDSEKSLAIIHLLSHIWSSPCLAIWAKSHRCHFGQLFLLTASLSLSLLTWKINKRKEFLLLFSHFFFCMRAGCAYVCDYYWLSWRQIYCEALYASAASFKLNTKLLRFKKMAAFLKARHFCFKLNLEQDVDALSRFSCSL